MKRNKLYKFIIVGHLIVNIPALILSLGLPIAIFNLIDQTPLNFVLACISFILGIGLSWLLWSLIIPKWRVWAFSQIHKGEWQTLKDLAVKNYLIWDNEHAYSKTEIRSEKDQIIIKKINEEINEQEEINLIKLDLSMHSELRYKLKKTEIYGEAFSKLMVMIFATILIITNQVILGLVLLALIFIIGDNINPFKYFTDNDDYLIINNKGIYVNYPKTNFVDWSTIDSLSLDPIHKQMIIKLNKERGEQKITYELKMFKIGDFKKFENEITVMVDRLIYSKS